MAILVAFVGGAGGVLTLVMWWSFWAARTPLRCLPHQKVAPRRPSRRNRPDKEGRTYRPRSV